MSASLFWSLQESPPFSVQRQERINAQLYNLVAILSLKSVEIKINQHPSGCCTLVVVQERPSHPPHDCKVLWVYNTTQ